MARSISIYGISLLAVLTSALAPPSMAWAEDADAARLRLFRERYELAGRAYGEKDYAAAIPALQDAYALQPAPQIVFNIAQAYRKLGDFRPAQTYFELYRSLIKDTMPDRLESVDRLILEMKESDSIARTPQFQVIEKTRTRTLYVQTEKPPARWLRPFGVITGIAGLGLLAAGATFLGLDGRCVTDPQPPALACDNLYVTKTPGTALTVVGAGALVLGTVTFALSLRKPRRPTVRETEAPPDEALPSLQQVMQPAAPADGEPAPTGWNRDGSPAKPR